MDWSETLSCSKFWGQWQAPGHAEHDKWLAIQEQFLGELGAAIRPWMRGQLTAEQFTWAMAQATGIKYTELWAELVASCCAMEFVSPQAPLAVAKLRDAGVHVVIATDNMDTFPRYTMPALQLGDQFDAILDSFSLRGLKSERDWTGRSGFFDQFMQEQGIGPGESLIIDDTKNVAGFIDLGIDYWTIECGGLMTAMDELVGQIG